MGRWLRRWGLVLLVRVLLAVMFMLLLRTGCWEATVLPLRRRKVP